MAILTFFINIFLFLFTFIIHILLSLVMTLIAASLTLVERRVLSLVQRRVGPNHTGFRGRLQFIADALKLLLKGINVPDLTNRYLFIFFPAFSLFICYTFWFNTLWGPNLSIVEIEYNIVYCSILSCLFSTCILLVGIFSRNKFSILAGIRSTCMVLNLEILLTFFFLCVVSLSESFSFSSAVHNQTNFSYFIFILLPIVPFIFIAFLLETNRAPFDLTEAESELVAGYTTELGGFFLHFFILVNIFIYIFFH